MHKFAHIVSYLKSIKGKKISEIKGMPRGSVNQDSTHEGTYDAGLADPGPKNWITGSGGGPVLG